MSVGVGVWCVLNSAHTPLVCAEMRTLALVCLAALLCCVAAQDVDAALMVRARARVECVALGFFALPPALLARCPAPS